jgi:hypothetical protein
MPAANSNRISASLTAEQIKQLHDAFDLIDAILDPIVVGLSVTERSSLPKINDSNKTFTADALLGARQNADLLPAYVNLDEMDKDLTLYNQLDPFIGRTSKIATKFSDTQMLAGSEAYVTGLAVYRLAESAANAGVAGADALYQVLKQRFAGQGNSGTPAVTPA